METWRTIRLGSACTTNSATYSPKEKWEFVNYLDTGNITNNRIDSIQYIDVESEKLPSRARRKVKTNSIIYSTVRPNQRHFGIIKSQPDNFLVSTGFAVIDVKPEILDADYLYYVLTQDSIVEKLHAIAEQSTSAYPSIKSSDIEDLEIEVPDLATQKKIAGILGELDRKAKQNAEINKNLESQAFSYFDYLQGITLNTCTIKYIAELNPTRTIKKGTIARYIGMSDLSTSISFPESWSYAQYKGGVKFVNGDTILAQITPCLENGKTAYIGLLNPDETAFGSTEYIVLSPKDGIPAPFLYCLARNKKFREFAIKNMTGTSGRQRVSATAISSFELKLPSKNQLQQFGSFTTTAFKIITNNGLENQKLAMLRDTLLPKLMSGEIDVSAVDL